jgi:DNA-binding MarR family transcriptional regulator
MSKRSPGKKRVRSLTEADYALLAGFRQALRDFIHFSETAAWNAGVPPHQHQAMLLIRGLAARDGLNVGQLASGLKIRHQSAVGLVKRMIDNGWVRKRRAPRDRREVIVTLTRSGRHILEKLSIAHKAEIARQRPVFRATLAKLWQNR